MFESFLGPRARHALRTMPPIIVIICNHNVIIISVGVRRILYYFDSAAHFDDIQLAELAAAIFGHAVHRMHMWYVHV